MKECVSCGNLFAPRVGGGKPQKHCSRECRVRHSERKSRLEAQRRERRLATQRLKCAECDGLLVHLDLGRPRKFCSDVCKTRASNRRARRALLPIRQRYSGTCKWCSESFEATRRGKIFCSQRCANAVSARRSKLGENGKGPKPCAICGQTFEACRSTHRWCSTRCRNTHFGRVRSRSRIKPSGATYTDREIFERDGWRCHLCEKLVRRDVARLHPDGATIDHIVPLALGGEDEPANVATAHWRCNRSKGTRAMGEQLALL